MSEDRAPARIGVDTTSRVAENQADYRQRMALLQAEAIERRQRELSEQCSSANPPADRIRIWERLHQLSLPVDPAHRLLKVIASGTGLSFEEVRAEQRERAAAKSKPDQRVT